MFSTSRSGSLIRRLCALSLQDDRPAGPTRRCARHAITDRRDIPDISERMLAKEPTDRSEAAEDTLAILSTEPIEPMLSSEFVEPMLSSDPRERRLRRDPGSWLMPTMVAALLVPPHGID